MSLDLLDAPLRVTWDVYQPGFHLSREDLLIIAERLLEGGVFFVWLDGSPVQHADIHELVSCLAQGCQVSLTLKPSRQDFSRLTAGWPVHALFLDVSGLGEDDFSIVDEAVRTVRALGYAPAMLLRPSRANLAQLPLVAHWCRSLEVGRLKLPNMPVSSHSESPEQEDLPGPRDVDELRRRIGGDADALRKDLDLEIHDLFIWEILFPAGHQGRGEFGGCQAANSLGHVAINGDLYPCSSWPLALGSLLRAPLTDLWQSPLRMDVRSAISRLPAACGGCRDLPLCLGGCRGLAEIFARHSEGRDLMCRGPR